jgi:hypothetical protein
MMKMRRAIEGSSVRVPNARARRAKRGQKTESQNPKGFGSSGWTRTSNPPVNRLKQVLYLVDSSCL